MSLDKKLVRDMVNLIFLFGCEEYNFRLNLEAQEKYNLEALQTLETTSILRKCDDESYMLTESGRAFYNIQTAIVEGTLPVAGTITNIL